MIERSIILPVIGAKICDDALGGGSCIVPRPCGSIPLVILRRDRPRIWVEKYLFRIETMAQFGSVWPTYPVAIQLPGPDSRQVHVPVMRCSARPGREANDAAWLDSIFRIEEQQLRPSCMVGEHAEVHTRTRNTCTDWIRAPVLHLLFLNVVAPDRRETTRSHLFGLRPFSHFRVGSVWKT